MKNFKAILTVFFFISGALQAQEKPVILPEPVQVNFTAGAKGLLLRDLTICLPANAPKDISFALRELTQMIATRTGKMTRMVNTPDLANLTYTIKNNGLELPVVADTSRSFQREMYSLSVSQSGLRIGANTSAGIYYAVQTIRQLIRGQGATAMLPAVKITDAPALPFRGVMMDFAHGGLLTIQEIKAQLDFLAEWKANQYYFYNEVTIQMNGYPTLNYGANYTKEEIKTIIAYGKERHIDVVPFVALYGHLHELLRNEKYAPLAIGKYGHEIDPANPQVNALMKDWIKQYVQLFESPFIHVGFDETWETKQIAERPGQRAIDPEQLFIKQLAFISNELKQYGKTVLAWTDMNNYYPDILTKFPKEVVPVIWEYTPDTAAINHYLRPVLKEKRSFFIQPAVSGWGHVYPNSNYTFDNIDLCLQAAMNNKALGFITSVWTDPVEPFVRPSWLFMANGSIGAWQGKVPDKNKFTADYTSFEYPAIAGDMHKAISGIAASGEYLGKCLGKNTGGLPRGTIVESWSNPFQPYYLENTKAHLDDFIASRKLSEDAEGILIDLLEKAPAKQQHFINSLLVSARLINYTASRFIWAKRICDRWKESTLANKKDDFVIYDITYSCHGLLVDMMDECGELKTAYEKAWLDEYKPYRLNTMLGRFDIEYGLWRKLFLKVLDHRIQLKDDEITKSFEELFKPEF